MSKLIQIHPNDNVLIVRQTILPGDEETINGIAIVFDKTIGLGHKIASTSIATGAIIYKYGVPIGSALNQLHPGDHVHLHNMKSDYIATYTLAKEFIHAK
jgi:hypothetical protein